MLTTLAIRSSHCLLTLVVWLLGLQIGRGAVQAPMETAPRFLVDARGRPARVDQQWTLRASDRNLNLFVSLVRCGSDVYLSDSQYRLYRFDTKTKGPLSLIADEDAGLGRPTAITADCAGGKLYVVNDGPKTVVTIQIGSGRLLGTLRFPNIIFGIDSAHFVPPDVLYMGGFNKPDEKAFSISEHQADTFYDSIRIGIKLSLTTGVAERGFKPYERKCIGAGSCFTLELDRLPGPGGPGAPRWVASQADSTAVGLYDEQGNLIRTIETASPMFRRDGELLPTSTKSTERLRWNGRNSIIRRVYGFADHVAIVHTLTEIGPDWDPGQLNQFRVFLNIHSLDGKGLVSDIRLPDIPIGRDETHLYFIDYGKGGRKPESETVQLLRVPVKRNGSGFQP